MAIVTLSTGREVNTDDVKAVVRTGADYAEVERDEKKGGDINVSLEDAEKIEKAKKTPKEVDTPPSPRGGISKEAWVAIGTIAAALITGIVTLIINLYPQKPAANPPSNSSTPAAAVTTPSPTPAVKTADAIAGKWSGKADDANGNSFQITLEIRRSCAVNERCGVISVSHVPCYGEVFLEKADTPDFEFRVANFYGQSNRETCQPGAGEHFHLRADGRLDYTTTYEPRAEGRLSRLSD